MKPTSNSSPTSNNGIARNHPSIIVAPKENETPRMPCQLRVIGKKEQRCGRSTIYYLGGCDTSSAARTFPAWSTQWHLARGL
jgi:hypothetical protein